MSILQFRKDSPDRRSESNRLVLVGQFLFTGLETTIGCAYFIYKNENDFRKSGKS
jgi:hypothetical protein